jgi:hypothetical protein
MLYLYHIIKTIAMKLKLLFILSIITLQTAFGQAEFEPLNAKTSIKKVFVSKKMFELMGNVKTDSGSNETQDYLELIKKLDDLKIYSSEETQDTQKMRLIFTNYAQAHRMKEIKTNQNQRSMYAISNAQNEILELLILVEKQADVAKTVLIHINGKFELREIHLLLQKMKLPGKEMISQL